MSVDLLLDWLVQATAPGEGTIRERYELSEDTWIAEIRPDCNVETMHAFLLKWKRSGDGLWLRRSRAIWDGIADLQDVDGSWPFSATLLPDKWINDNANVVIYLLACSDLDTGRAATYQAAALSTVDYLLAAQRVDGAWQNGYVPASAYAPMWAGHALAALATAYAYADPGTQASIVTSVEDGAAWIGTQLEPDGRVITTYEVHGDQESWRPPSSDQAICVLGLALALRLVPSAQTSSWASLLAELRGWLDPLIDPSGAIKNGYGDAVTLADVAHITDNVYTNPIAAAAYLECYRAKGNIDDLRTANRILDFLMATQWEDSDPDAHGCIRGAYDLTAQDFDTSEVPQNGGEEGGGDMAYTGWSAAPTAVLLMNRTLRRGAALVAA